MSFSFHFTINYINKSYNSEKMIKKIRKVALRYMQGYILNIQRVRDEDLIVTILAREHLETVYRFYGCRHGIINLGYKIDFEIERTTRTSIGRLRDVSHLSYPWLLDRGRVRLWQQWIELFHVHLRETESIGPFYFTLLDHAANHWNKQNPKRVAIENYVQLLRHEGRLNERYHCFFCDAPIHDSLSLIRALHPAHPECSHRSSFERHKIQELFKNGSSLFIEDDEVEKLWQIIREGF